MGTSVLSVYLSEVVPPGITSTQALLSKSYFSRMYLLASGISVQMTVISDSVHLPSESVGLGITFMGGVDSETVP